MSFLFSIAEMRNWRTLNSFKEGNGEQFLQAEAVELCYQNVNGSCIKTPYSAGPRAILYAVLGLGAVLAMFGNFTGHYCYSSLQTAAHSH